MKNLKFDPKNWEWYSFLDASKEIKEKYNLEADVRAGNWHTCACGQVCNMLPKKEYNMPLDDKILDLGIDFCGFIGNEYWNKAKITLDEIEARTIFLLKQPNYIDPKTL